MRTFDKIISTVCCILLLLFALSYQQNIDMYRMVDNYNPISGFVSLADKLSDREWVEETCDEWVSTQSYTLNSLYKYLTNSGADNAITNLKLCRTYNVFVLLLSLSFWPASVVTSAVRAKPKEVYHNG